MLVPACRVVFAPGSARFHDDEPEVAPVRARLSSSLGPSLLAGDGRALDSAVPFPSVPQESHVGTRRHGLAQHGEDMVVVALHDRQGPDRPRGRLRRWGPRSQTDHRFPRRAALARSIIADAMAGPAHGDVLWHLPGPVPGAPRRWPTACSVETTGAAPRGRDSGAGRLWAGADGRRGGHRSALLDLRLLDTQDHSWSLAGLEKPCALAHGDVGGLLSPSHPGWRRDDLGRPASLGGARRFEPTRDGHIADQLLSGKISRLTSEQDRCHTALPGSGTSEGRRQPEGEPWP